MQQLQGFSPLKVLDDVANQDYIPLVLRMSQVLDSIADVNVVVEILPGWVAIVLEDFHPLDRDFPLLAFEPAATDIEALSQLQAKLAVPHAKIENRIRQQMVDQLDDPRNCPVITLRHER